MKLFTSDTHYGHEKILEYCNRPFVNVSDQQRQLINRWNQRVDKEDIVYHLGDFSLYLRKEQVAFILSLLNGTKILVKGNHDHKDTYKAVGWHDVVTHAEVSLGETQPAMLVHDPNQVDTFWPHAKGLVLHGHQHGMKGRPGRPMPQNEGRKYIDVGVDVEAMDYAPISEFELLNLFRR